MGKHCDTCKCRTPKPPNQKKIMENFERARKKCVEVNGAFYDKNSKPEVIAALEDARRRDVIVQIASGFTEEYPPSMQDSDRPIGEDWMNEGFAVGRVHLTMGPLKSPILVEPGDDGGTIISPDSTVRIRERGTGKVLYQHPKYMQPTLTMGPVDNKGGHSFKEAVYSGGGLHAQFDRAGGAAKWAKEFGWVIS